MGTQSYFSLQGPQSSPKLSPKHKGAELRGSCLERGLFGVGFWGPGGISVHAAPCPLLSPRQEEVPQPLPCLSVGEKPSWNGLGKLPALPKRRDPQHPHPSLPISLPVCGRNELPPCPCSPKTLLFLHILHDFLVPPRNHPKPGGFSALQEKEAKSLWPREQPRVYFVPLQRIIWNSTLQGRRCCMNSNQG